MGPLYFMREMLDDHVTPYLCYNTGFCRHLCIQSFVCLLHRRHFEYGIAIQDTYSVITSKQLDQIVAPIQHVFSLCC